MTTLRSTAIALTAAIAILAANAPAQAGGKNFGAALLGGFVAGAIISHAANSHGYNNGGYGVVYQQKCWWEKQFAGYDYYGNPVFQKVQVCG